jgi:hypothetical protein
MRPTRPPDPIAAYADALRKALAFDPRGAREAAWEAEAHLRDAAEAASARGASEPEAEAVRRFGPIRAATACFAAARLPARLRETARLLAASALLLALAMRLRRELAPPSADDWVGAALTLDRAALLAAAMATLAAFWLGRRPETRPRLGMAALAVAAAALAASVAAGLLWAVACRPSGTAAVAGVTAALTLEGIVLLRLGAALRGLRRHARAALSLA